MRKLFLLGVAILPMLGGCSFDTDMNIDTMMYSGKDILSETWETTKEAGKEYYEEQVKPFVDTAKEEIIDKANQIKNQYNQEVEKINETIQEQANQVKDQVNKLKVE